MARHQDHDQSAATDTCSGYFYGPGREHLFNDPWACYEDDDSACAMDADTEDSGDCCCCCCD